MVDELGAAPGDDAGGLEAHAADARLALTTLDADRHPRLERLRVIERPLPVDDRIAVRMQADAVPDLKREELGFVLVAPGARGREVPGRVARRGAGFDRADDVVQTLDEPAVPVLRLRVGLDTHGERARLGGLGAEIPRAGEPR